MNEILKRDKELIEKYVCCCEVNNRDYIFYREI